MLGIKRTLKNYIRYKPLVHELVLRDLKVKYRRSFLGYIWSLLNPLLMMSVMSVVFSYMFRYNIPNYPLYLICGQTLWTFFNESTNMAMYSIIQNASLIKKVYIPKYIFPISRVVSCFVTMSFSLVAILIVMVATKASFSPYILLFPIPLVLLFVFCMGISFILSSLSVYFRDIVHLYGVLTMAWMYLTPIFYPVEALPIEIFNIVKFNPMYSYITFFRDIVLFNQIPELTIWLNCFLASFISILIGFVVFRKSQRNFILYI